MRYPRIRMAFAVAVLPGAILAVLPTTAGVAAATTHKSPQRNVAAVCAVAPAGFAHCLAEIRTDVHGGRGVRGPAARAVGKSKVTLPQGYGPADLRSAYKLPAKGGAGQTVAVVDAGDDSTAEADLAVYRKTYGLPACTTANGCFHKVNQAGTASPLPTEQGWDVETSLDLDMVSAACPSCHIMLAEGNDANDSNLGATVNTAVRLGAKEVSNSYGAEEFNGVKADEADYSHPGVAILASSGDDGYGIPGFPAVSPKVIAVGGTSLTKASNARGWTEKAWNGAASGCSAYFTKPSWQVDANCPGRMTSDVAADADPNTGPAIYDTDAANGSSGFPPGWNIVGGTSASSPYIAGVIALAGNPAAFSNASRLYSHASHLFDVIGGNNVEGTDCGGDYQCNAVAGYDGPTGNGTPNGISAF